MLTTANVPQFPLCSVTLRSSFKHSSFLRRVKIARWGTSTFLKILMGSAAGGGRVQGGVKLNWNRLFHL